MATKVTPAMLKWLRHIDGGRPFSRSVRNPTGHHWVGDWGNVTYVMAFKLQEDELITFIPDESRNQPNSHARFEQAILTDLGRAALAEKV